MKVAFIRKPQDLKEVKNTVRKFSGSIESVEITHEVTLNNRYFNDLTNNFFQSIASFSGKGGVINGMTQAIKIVNHDTQEEIFINPEGYSYARYVGIRIDSIN